MSSFQYSLLSSVVAFLHTVSVYGQSADTVNVQSANKQSNLKPKSTVIGNAADKVFLTDANEPCQFGQMGVAIHNTGDDVVIAYIEVSVTSGANPIQGHLYTKRIKVDNLSPKELRFLGCKGCKTSQSGKVCTTYKLLGANSK